MQGSGVHHAGQWSAWQFREGCHGPRLQDVMRSDVFAVSKSVRLMHSRVSLACRGPAYAHIMYTKGPAHTPRFVSVSLHAL